MQLTNLTNFINVITWIGEFCLLIGPTVKSWRTLLQKSNIKILSFSRLVIKNS